jgi:hypothetical protein
MPMPMQPRSSSSPWVALALTVTCSCQGRTVGENLAPIDASAPTSSASPTPGALPDPSAPKARTIVPPVAAEQAPAASPRLPTLPSLDKLTQASASYFAGHVGRRMYVQIDKPLYQPGETIWFRSWDLAARSLSGDAIAGGVTYELINPKGAAILTKRVTVARGLGTNDFVLPEGIEGGEYTLRATSMDGQSKEDRPIIVSAYQAPRLKKKLEFVRKAYGAGDEVAATIKVERPTGEPLANHPLRGSVWLDGETLQPVSLTTNADGGGVVRFKLPSKIAKGDGLLTVLVDDGGITESVSKRIPIVLKSLQLAFFPEGGVMLSGAPTRVYFEAKDPIGKPADIEGRIVDDHGQAVATFSSYHEGLGKFGFTPSTGRTYSAEITKPVGVTEKYPLPLAQADGCVLRSYDDLDGAEKALRVGVRCATARKVVVVGMLRENLLDAAAVDVAEGAEAVVYLEPKEATLVSAQGAARVTVLSEELTPLAERLVYRNRRKNLTVKVSADRPTYTPREQVALTLETLDEAGAPVAAELAVAVVDDTVLSFADDKTGHLLSRVYLEQEIPDKVEEPRPFFDLTEPKSAQAMDLLMGTRGWRKFEWNNVMNPPPPPRPMPQARGLDDADLDGAIGGLEGDALADFGGGEGIGGLGVRGVGAGGGGKGAAARGGAPRAAAQGAVNRQPAALAAPPADAVAPIAAAAPPPPPPAGAPAEKPAAMEPAKKRLPERAQNEVAEAEAVADRPVGRAAAGQLRVAEEPPLEEEAKRERRAPARRVAGWAPVRVFPAPTYRGDEPTTRTDFRETIHWVPSVTTGKSGRATVTFYLSDAVTSFRAVVEGAGGGRLGRAEQVVRSSLPFSMDVKLPLEVSAGDTILAPLTLTNERPEALKVALNASFGELVSVDRPATLQDGMLGATQRASLYYGLTVGGRAGKSVVKVAATTAGLGDEFSRELTVVPLGFPQALSASGTLKEKASHTFDLGQALPGSGELTIKLYPSPVATLVSGMDGLLREPSGCFEQTSSTNYPNVMVLDYLRTNDVADPALVERASGMLDRGYKKLVGFETAQKGYEWFGQAPAHEALTAYGLVQFTDMKRITGVGDDEMMARTAKYLETRRDGQGGYLRDGKALDSFGRASPEVTDAYVTWALSEAGFTQFGPEFARSAALAQKTSDEYLLALTAGTLLNVPSHKSTGMAAARRLAGLQGSEGAWTRADHSITRSTGINLHIETTALALLALMKAGGQDDQVRAGVAWLAKNRGGYGEWGATQATVLALRAMTTYANYARRTPSPGMVIVRLDGKEVGRQSYAAGRREALVFTGLGSALTAGAHTLELVHDGKGDLPYSIAMEYRSLKPATAPDVVVDLKTQLERSSLKMGETVRLTATVSNKTSSGQPMTLARVGLPGGLTFQTWQLKELREKGQVAFWETRPREVILYFRELAPSEVKTVGIDLVAQVPGEYTGPASSAYLYYGNDKKVWVDPLKVSIAAPQ